MIPTSIDGTDITGATVDGTDVTEITVDGDVVFSAGPSVIDDFEDGNINGWNHVTSAGGGINISNTGFNSNHSLELGVTTGGANSVGYFDSFGLQDFTDSFTLSAYIRFDSQNFNKSHGFIGYLFDQNDSDKVLMAGLTNTVGDFMIGFDGRVDSNVKASTNFTASPNVWYEIELEFDGTDHIARLYDDSQNLLETVTWSNSAANAKSSAYVASAHVAGGLVTHQHLVDNFTL